MIDFNEETSIKSLETSKYQISIYTHFLNNFNIRQNQA